MRRWWPEVLSALWGFAEATFFFLVPDIWLSRMALHDPKRALRNCLVATVGALLGGLGVYLAAEADFGAVRRLLEAIPAISPGMIDRAGAALGAAPLSALLEGMAGGTPYKIYAAWAGDSGLNLALFMAYSALARLLRFALVTSFGVIGAWIFHRWLSLRAMQMIHLALWIAFYIGYFYVFGVN